MPDCSCSRMQFDNTVLEADTAASLGPLDEHQRKKLKNETNAAREVKNGTNM